MTIPHDIPPTVREIYSGPAVSGRGAAPGRVGSRGAASGESRPRGAVPHDQVEVSGIARLMLRITEQAQRSPAERSRLIAALRAEIDAGTYTVDARRLAERLLPGLERPA